MNIKAYSKCSAFFMGMCWLLVFPLSAKKDPSYYQYFEGARTAKDSAVILFDQALTNLDKDPSQSRVYATDLLSMTRRKNWIKLEATALTLLALYYETIGSYEDAISEWDKAINVLLPYDSLEADLGGYYANLSIAYKKAGALQNSLNFRKKTVEIQVKYNQHHNLIMSYVDLGQTYQKLNRFDSASFYLNQTLQITSASDESITANVHSILGDIYLKSGSWDQAWDAYTYNYEYLSKDSSASMTCRADAEIDFAEYFLATSQSDKVKSHLDSALTLSNSLSHKDHKAEVLRLYSEYYQQLNQPMVALNYYKLYHKLTDSINGLSVESKIADLQSDFDLTRRELEIENLKNTSSLKDITIQRKREEAIYLGLVALLASILLVVTLYFLSRYRSQSKQLQKNNALIKKKHEEIEYLIRESHHRIKNNLQVISSLLRIQGQNVRSDMAKSALNEAYNRIKTITMMHQSLQGSHTFKQIPIHDYLNQLAEYIQKSMTADESSIAITTELDQVEIDTDKSIAIGLIVNELVTNSLKYATKEGQAGIINIILKQHQKQLVLNVSDNGPGFPKDFDPLKNNSFGYKVINSLTAKLKGEISLSNQNGAFVQITLPYEQAA